MSRFQQRLQRHRDISNDYARLLLTDTAAAAVWLLCCLTAAAAPTPKAAAAEGAHPHSTQQQLSKVQDQHQKSHEKAAAAALSSHATVSVPKPHAAASGHAHHKPPAPTQQQLGKQQEDLQKQHQQQKFSFKSITQAAVGRQLNLAKDGLHNATQDLTSKQAVYDAASKQLSEARQAADAAKDAADGADAVIRAKQEAYAEAIAARDAAKAAYEVAQAELRAVEQATRNASSLLGDVASVAMAAGSKMDRAQLAAAEADWRVAAAKRELQQLKGRLLLAESRQQSLKLQIKYAQVRAIPGCVCLHVRVRQKAVKAASNSQACQAATHLHTAAAHPAAVIAAAAALACLPADGELPGR